jgi:hypothetical protein
MLPAGVHLADGGRSELVLVDDAWSDADPRCSVCGSLIDSTFFRCLPCDAVVCRMCVARDTAIVECDCAAEVAVTGVQLAAIRAAAQLSH